MTVRKKWIAAAAVAFAIAAFLAHAPILQCLAGFLVVNEPPGDFQYVGILEWGNRPDGNHCYDAVARLLDRKPSAKVLVVEPRSDRLVDTGILPSLETLSRRELTARGVPSHAITTIPRDGANDWATARALRDWLASRPNDSIVVFCGAFRSVHLRYAIDTLLDGPSAARVCVQALPDWRFNESDWWKSRTGIKVFGIEWLRLLRAWCVGGDPLPPSYRDADEYERDALAQGTP